MNLKDLNIEELPSNTIRVYSSDTKYLDFNSHESYRLNDGHMIIQHRTNGPSFLMNVDIGESGAHLYVHYRINGRYINGRARFWFKDNKLINDNIYSQYFYDNKHLMSIKNDKDYFKFLKMQVFK